MLYTENNNLDIQGHLTIHKIIKGEEELVYDDKNVIVSGFGWSLAHMLSRQGSDTITDFQIDRFQIGVSGHTGLQVSSTYELSGPLSSTQEYTTDGDSNIFAVSADQIKRGAIVGTSVYGKIPFSKVTKIDTRSVRYTIFIDEDSCNNLSRPGATEANLSEIGLFIKNPLGQVGTDASVLAAYKYFSVIRKTSDFGLVFRWTISFG